MRERVCIWIHIIGIRNMANHHFEKLLEKLHLTLVRVRIRIHIEHTKHWKYCMMKESGKCGKKICLFHLVMLCAGMFLLLLFFSNFSQKILSIFVVDVIADILKFMFFSLIKCMHKPMNGRNSKRINYQLQSLWFSIFCVDFSCSCVLYWNENLKW